MSDTIDPSESEQDKAIAELVKRTVGTELLSESLARRVSYLEELAAVERVGRASNIPPRPVKRKPDPGPDGGEHTGLLAILFVVAVGAVLLYRWWCSDDAE